jgi:hypothetical protein
VSSYSPPDDEETSGSATSDGRDVATQRSIETVSKLSRRDKAIAVLAISTTSAVVAVLAFGHLVPDSAFAERVAQTLRDLGIDAGALLRDVSRTISNLF